MNRFVHKMYNFILVMFYKNVVYRNADAEGNVPMARYLRYLAFLSMDFRFRVIKLDINSECNLNCRNCYCKLPGAVLTQGHIFRLLDQLKRGFKNREIRLDIVGKEPLLRKDLFEIVQYAKEVAKIETVTLFTNGTLIDGDTAYKLKQAGVDVALVTLYSPHKLVHDWITQIRGSWDKTVAGIKSLCAAGIRTYSLTVLMNHNVNSLKEIKCFVESLGARAAYFPYIQQQPDDPLCIKTAEEFQGAVDWLFRNSPPHQDNVLDSLNSRGKICSAFVSCINIKADGTVTPCPFIDIALGNIKDEGFYSILHRAYAHSELISFLSTPEECRSCSIVNLCKGGCKASGYSLFREVKRKDRHCRGPYYRCIPPENLGEYIPCIY